MDLQLSDAFWARLRAEMLTALTSIAAATGTQGSDFLTQKEAAVLLGVTPGTIRARQRLGKLGRYDGGRVKRSELYAQAPAGATEGTTAEERKAEELLKKRR